jgi:hypothetical protein
LTSRTAVSSAVVRLMLRNPVWMDVEANFRRFMFELNKYGGGIVFEAMPDAELDDFMQRCAKIADVHLQKNKVA